MEVEGVGTNEYELLSGGAVQRVRVWVLTSMSW